MFSFTDPLILSLLIAPVYYLIALLFHKFFSYAGLYVFMAIALIGANLQVLKLSYFPLFDSPVALGTVLFSTTYFVTDLLSEHHGKKKAITAIVLGLVVMQFWLLITQATLLYPPLTPAQSAGDYDWALGTHGQMSSLFAFFPGIAFASIGSYLISQFFDIYLYGYIRGKTGDKYLFIRNNVSTLLSTLIDNACFSLLAFYLLSPSPVPLKELIFSYILGTYLLRIIYALLDTPFMYLSKTSAFSPKKMR